MIIKTKIKTWYGLVTYQAGYTVEWRLQSRQSHMCDPAFSSMQKVVLCPIYWGNCVSHYRAYPVVGLHENRQKFNESWQRFHSNSEENPMQCLSKTGGGGGGGLKIDIKGSIIHSNDIRKFIVIYILLIFPIKLHTNFYHPYCYIARFAEWYSFELLTFEVCLSLAFINITLNLYI